MKNLIIILSILLCVANAVAQDQSNKIQKVLISQIVKHPALDATVQGIIDGLAEKGFIQGNNLEIRTEFAQGNTALASQIATKFANQTPDVVVGVGTISAQALSKYAKIDQAKLVFSSVTDPLGARLVHELNIPKNNTSGVSNFVDLEPQIQLFQQIQPELKRLGIIYNMAEVNSVSIVKQLEVLCKKLNIALIKQTANATSEIAQVATKLSSQVDAIFISNDNTALSALQSIIAAANKAKPRIPVYVSDTDAVELGALAALGPNQYAIGLQTGAMIARSLNGEDLNYIAVEFPSKNDLYINMEAAKTANINIPKEIQEKAVKIIEKSKI